MPEPSNPKLERLREAISDYSFPLALTAAAALALPISLPQKQAKHSAAGQPGKTGVEAGDKAGIKALADSAKPLLLSTPLH